MSQAQTRQRVEYKTIEVGRDTEEKLNQLAEEGWRVTERIDVEDRTWELVMERPVNGGDHE